MTKAAHAREQWLAERRTYLGATDISAILGLNPYDSPREVWLRKMGLVAEKEATLPMELGTFLEPFIAAQYTKRTGIKSTKAKTVRHPKFPFLACNPDRNIKLKHDGHTYKGLLELKSVGHWASANFGQDGSDQVPEHYLIQCLWQLIITRADFVQLVALVDNRELRIFTYTLIPELSTIAHVFTKEKATQVFNDAIRWWNLHIIEGVEPEMTGHDSDTDRLKSYRSEYDNGFTANPDEKTDNECAKLARSLTRLERAQLCEAERKNRIKKFMADANASVLETRYGAFTWKTDTRGIASFRHPYKTRKA